MRRIQYHDARLRLMVRPTLAGRMRKHGGVAVAMLLLLASSPTWPTAPAVALPMERVVLSTAGVGYFQHGGSVSGDATVELMFTPAQLNDVLKSLVVEDAGDGRVASVVFPNQEPLERLLGSFAIDLSGHPSLTALFAQLRGAQVRLVLEGGETLEGRVLGTETRPQPAGEVVIEATYVSIANTGGIRSAELGTIRSFALADSHLQSELDKALVALAQGRATDKKAVAVSFSGRGERRVAIGYVVEAPVWKTSYRLVLPRSGAGGKPAIQAWAIVENTTGHDWSKVDLALVSGRPLSFIEDLYKPQYLARPVHRPQRFAGIGPQTYEIGMDADMSAEAVREVDMARKLAMAPTAAPAPMSAPARSEEARGAQDFTASVRSIAGAESLGATFQYTVTGASVARHGSAMLPIVAEPIEAQPVSIHDPKVLARHPLRGVRLTNSTGKHLPGGPMTVMEGDGYAGDARIDDLPAGGERLLSFAVDLEVSIQQRDPGSESTLIGARIERGVLQLQQSRLHRTAFALKSEASEARHVLLTHPARAGWDLVDTPKPEERTETHYRFGVDLGAGKSREFVIQEGRTDWETVQIGTLDERAMLGWASNARLPQSVRDALARAAQLRRELAAGERAVAAPRQRIAEIAAEQQRIRSNIQSLQRGTPLYDRLIEKLNEQETELESLDKALGQAREQLNAAQAALEGYLAGLEAR